MAFRFDCDQLTEATDNVKRDTIDLGTREGARGFSKR